MSVDYSSVLIYGFQIPLTNDNCAAMWHATGEKEFWEYSDIVDEQFPTMTFITDNALSDPDFGYFGIVFLCLESKSPSFSKSLFNFS